MKTSERIRFRGGYRYQLAEEYSGRILIFGHLISTDYIELKPNGELRIRVGYCWDGASGPALDTKTILRGSLIHDALYQLLRQGHLPNTSRAQADFELYYACRKDGMSWIRAQYVYRAVRLFGNTAAAPEHRRLVREAP